MFFEKIISLFKLPLSEFDYQYVDYVLNRYSLSKIPVMKEYLTFIRNGNHINHYDFRIALKKQNNAWLLEYSMMPDTKINKKYAGHSALNIACYLGLTEFIRHLLKWGATVSENNINAIHSNTLTAELTTELIIAGVDLGKALFHFSLTKTEGEVKAIVDVVGKDKLEAAIRNYSTLTDKTEIDIYHFLLKIQTLFLEEKANESVLLLPHSTLFPTVERITEPTVKDLAQNDPVPLNHQTKKMS